ncbi:MAG TPA: ribosome small subunit-dependent GTPase A [Aggregatilineales bacterium]|nr:ribosome small subunit-dependent GTPase A [Aggregatilineales bacterium]
MTQRDLPGLVVKTQSGFYAVQTDAGLIICSLRGTLKQSSKKTELCVIGDRVVIDVLPDGSGAINRIEPRLRVLSRVEPSAYAGTSTEREQVLIANLDQAVLVFSAANPVPNPRVLDRLIVAAEKAEIPSIAIVANKIDLDEAAARAIFGIYEAIGYPVYYVSAARGIGIDDLRTLLTGHLSAFTGPSGAGKTSLLNAVQPGLGHRVREVSAKLTKGRHTTVNAELIPLADGGYVADTPGIRSIAPWDVEPGELDAYFREIHPYTAQCRFSDCTHTNEPGCAVLAAVKHGHIAPTRYDSYVRLRAELDAEYVY